MVKINWTSQAKYDLKEIFNFIAKDSRKYAHQQISKIRVKVLHLKTQTNLGKINKEFNDDNIREFIVGNYRIIYRIKNKDRIDILLVHHGARNLTYRIKNLK
ncbi:MAG: type II toxin-antitoxin system RelE/ParE family toxin [Chitinophagales bacterium]